MPRVSLDRSFSAVVAAGGGATITLQTNGSEKWTIHQISVECTGAPVGATGAIRKNGNLVTPFIPTGEGIGNPPPLTLAPGDTVTIVWAGCTPGALAKALVIFDKEPY